MSKENVHVICPHCGTEFELGDSNRKVTTTDKIPDGIYTLIPKNDQRLNQLKDLGIDITKFFGMDNPSVTFSSEPDSADHEKDDEIKKSIKDDGYVEGKGLWRRWVMAQMFRAISYEDGFDAYYKRNYDYQYSWDVLVNEFKAQAKIKDAEELEQRRKFFNAEVASKMIGDYIKIITKILRTPGKRKKCKGEEYVHFPYCGNYFIYQLEESVSEAASYQKFFVSGNTDPKLLYEKIREFDAMKLKLPKNTSKGNNWRNAFIGAGAFYTLDNLIKFHGCRILANDQKGSIDFVKGKVEEYKHDFYRLFMFMKHVIEDNNYVYGSDF